MLQWWWWLESGYVGVMNHDSHAKWQLVIMHHTKRTRATLHTLAVVVKARGLRLHQQQKRQIGSAHHGLGIHESVQVSHQAWQFKTYQSANIYSMVDIVT